MNCLLYILYVYVQKEKKIKKRSFDRTVLPSVCNVEIRTAFGAWNDRNIAACRNGFAYVIRPANADS